jgi:hypothetical protein
MSEIQSVNVFSIDQERLKYRVILTTGILPGTDNFKGVFNFIIPPPTNFANSSHYNQCTIKLDSFTATPSDLAANLNPMWAVVTGPEKLGCVIIELDTPSSQVVEQRVASAADVNNKGLTNIRMGQFRQLLPLQIVNVGNRWGAAGGGASPDPLGYSWVGIGSGIAATDPVLCGNIFGRDTRLRIIHPHELTPAWIQQGVVPNSDNIAVYTFSFTITMIPNN